MVKAAPGAQTSSRKVYQVTLIGNFKKYCNYLGQISVTSDKKAYYVLTGEDVEIIWKISGIEASNLKLREWTFLTANTILALINNDDKLIVNNGSILNQGFEVRKPSTLYLKNVDRRFDGKYEFSIRKNLDIALSEVTVIALSKCL